MTKTLRAPLATVALLAALASGCSLTPPERPAYDGPDLVGSDVDPGSLVGVWRVTPLNPYPDEGEQETVIEYRADGSVVGEIDPSEDESMAVLGDTQFRMTGNWSVSDGAVAHENIEMEALSDNAFAQLMANMINGLKRDLGGTADILELEADRIVMLGDDGGAMRYDRVE